MKKITANEPESKTADIVAENIGRLKMLFPEAFTEGKIDFDVLKQLLSGNLEECEEKYGLNWHGKRRARQISLTPSTGTLRPCPEDSLDWDKTKNLMIEGNNLEVLKLLQKSYSGKVKLIYIDPPYNTGKDFVYPDDFSDSIRNYQRITGQIDDSGCKISSNTESSGRFHTDWLNMMLPRLKVARNLLRDDGAILVSIGDEEEAGMRMLLNEVFGEENYSATFAIIRSEGGGLAKQVVKGHDYLYVYAKNLNKFSPLRRPRDVRGEIVDVEGVAYWIEEDWLRREFGKYGTCAYSEIEKYHGPEKKKEIDAGIAKGLYRLITKKDGAVIVGRLRKLEDDSSKFYSVQKHLNAKSANDLEAIKMEPVFDFPKPISLIQEVVLGGSFFTKSEGDIILDFFAGSGTTAHAIMAQNVADGGNRRYLLVQLPEPLSPEVADQKLAAEFCDKIKKPRHIAELTKERLRRAAKTIKHDNPKTEADLGFRVFKLDSTNIQEWDPDRENLPETLQGHIEHVKADRSESDILFELLLKLGLDLTVPIEAKTIAGKKVYSVGAGVLLTCLDAEVAATDVEPLGNGIVAWHKELNPSGDVQVVFRDNAFSNDITKTNLTAILEQNGIFNVRSL